MVKIIENATIIFKNDSKELFDAISITENGIYTGHIGLKNNKIKDFVNHSFIPINQIQKIISYNENDNTKTIDFLKKFRYYKEVKRK